MEIPREVIIAFEPAQTKAIIKLENTLSQIATKIKGILLRSHCKISFYKDKEQDIKSSPFYSKYHIGKTISIGRDKYIIESIYMHNHKTIYYVFLKQGPYIVGVLEIKS